MGHFTIISFVFCVLFISCGGCGSVKDVEKEKPFSNLLKDTLKNIDNNNGTLQLDKYIGYPEVKLTRHYLGKEVSLQWNTAHKGGQSYNSVWEEVVPDKKYERKK